MLHPHKPSDLSRRVQMWLTPKTPTGGGQNYRTTPGGGLRKLEDQAEWRQSIPMWATPTTQDWKDGTDPSEKAPTNSLLGRQAPRSEISGPPSSPSDPTSRQQWQTPTVQDAQSRPYTYPSGDKTNAFPTLMGQAAGWPKPRLRLSPLFVEWLMGFPEGWTDSRPSATPPFQRWRRWHGIR